MCAITLLLCLSELHVSSPHGHAVYITPTLVVQLTTSLHSSDVTAVLCRPLMGDRQKALACSCGQITGRGI